MSYSLTSALAAASLFLAVGTASLLGQQPAAQPRKEIKIQGVTLESAAVSGNPHPWIRVVTQFQTTPRWADGIVFSYNVLLGAENQYKVLQGTVRYANVKAGANRAVMYISPNTAERFGAPLAVHVKAFYKEDVADEFTYKGAGSFPATWETQYDKFPGLLMTVVHTPFVLSDYSASPDLMGN